MIYIPSHMYYYYSEYPTTHNRNIVNNRQYCHIWNILASSFCVLRNHMNKIIRSIQNSRWEWVSIQSSRWVQTHSSRWVLTNPSTHPFESIHPSIRMGIKLPTSRNPCTIYIIIYDRINFSRIVLRTPVCNWKITKF